MKIIEKESWPRKAHFDFFYSMEHPRFDLCTTIDITRFLAFVRAKKLPFYPAMIHCVMRALNEVEEFRLRIRDGQIVLHETVHPSFTDLNREDGLFKIVTVDMEEDMTEFCRHAKASSAAQTEYFPPAVFSGRDDLIYITCVPWISFTQVTHPYSQSRDDSVPRVAWGKYEEQNGKATMPLSIEANHALADGYHVAEFVRLLQGTLSGLTL